MKMLFIVNLLRKYHFFVSVTGFLRGNGTPGDGTGSSFGDRTLRLIVGSETPDNGVSSALITELPDLFN
jgi:hypothetical protein